MLLPVAEKFALLTPPSTRHLVRGVATCTHGRTCVPEKVLKKGNSGFICSPCAKKKENIQKIISEFTGENDRTLSLCL